MRKMLAINSAKRAKPAAKPAVAVKPVKPAATAIVASAAPAAAPVAPSVAPAAPAAPVKHENVALTYAGPSPTVRGHGRKLTPIAEPGTKSFGPATARDDSFIADMRATYGAGGSFLRLDADAGCVNRAIYYGRLRLGDRTSGDLNSRTLRLHIVPPVIVSAVAPVAKPGKRT